MEKTKTGKTKKAKKAKAAEEPEKTQVPEEAEPLAEAALEEEEDEEEVISKAEREAKVEKKKKEIEEEIVEERFYTIPLRIAWISPRKKRAPMAVRILKGFVKKHMKIKTEVEGEEEPETLVVSNEVNEKIWGRGIEKPPRNIRVRAVKDKEGRVTVYLAEGH
jgi:large subunit ribosomal protein L31e